VDLTNMNVLLSRANNQRLSSGADPIEAVAALASIVTSLSNLSLYDQRRRRAANDVERRILAMQADRLNKQEADLIIAVRHSQLHKARGLPWSPAENGFVCSQREIDAYIRRYQADLQVSMLRILTHNPDDPRVQDFKGSLKIQPKPQY